MRLRQNVVARGIPIRVPGSLVAVGVGWRVRCLTGRPPVQLLHHHVLVIGPGDGERISAQQAWDPVVRHVVVVLEPRDMVQLAPLMRSMVGEGRRECCPTSSDLKGETRTPLARRQRTGQLGKQLRTVQLPSAQLRRRPCAGTSFRVSIVGRVDAES